LDKKKKLFNLVCVSQKKIAHEHKSLKCNDQVSDNDMNCEKAQSQGIGFLFF